MAKGKITKRKFTHSNGSKKSRDARRRAKVLERKVKRWDSYRKKGKHYRFGKNHVCSNWKGATCASRHNNWDTTGLLKQIAFLNKVV